MGCLNPRLRQVLACAFIAALAAVPLRSEAHATALSDPGGSNAAATSSTVLPNGRLVTPVGTTYNLGDLPLGLALSPDGRLAVAINSGQGQGLNSGFGSYCNLSPCPYTDPPEPLVTATIGYSGTPTYDDSLSVVDLISGTTRQVTAVPTSYDQNHPRFNFFYSGLAFSPNGRHLYASGGGNDALYDFPVYNDVVAPAPIATVTLTDTVKDQPPLIYYGNGHAFTRGLAVTPDGRYVLVAHEFQNTLDIVDTRTYGYQQVPLSQPIAVGGAHPYGVVVGRDGTTAYVSEQGFNQIAVVKLSLGSGMLVGTVPVGDHPTGLALSPDGSQLYVANAGDDTLSILTIDSSGMPAPAATLPLHAFPAEAPGSTPNAVAVSPDGQRIYVTLAGDNAVAVLGAAASFEGAARGAAGPLSSPAPRSIVVGGLIPAGWYPSAVATSNDGSTVYIVSAKGLGSRYVPPYVTTPRSGAVLSTFDYVGNNMPGLLQTLPAPDGTTLLAMTARVWQNIAHATGADSSRSPHNPIPAETITGTTSLTVPVDTPIKYVIEVVRENRTFDQVLGDVGVDEGRNLTGTDTVNGYAGFSIFGRDVTPNAHALVGDPTTPDPAYATSDNFYSDGEVSVQGHWWTTAAYANDYLEKSWVQYYSSRNHFNDPVAAIAQPRNCSIFQQAQARARANPPGTFTFRNYGEVVGLKIDIPFLPFPTGPNAPCKVSLLANSALSPTIINDAINLDHDDRTMARAFLNDVGLDDNGHVVTPTRRMPNFSYLYMGGDHTGGLSFVNTPRSRVAQNDAGLGLLVQSLSQSPYWSQTAIFVMEDDSQDGLDHVDGHRNVLYVISPYAKHLGADGKAGYISHRQYSQVSVLKTMELLLGLPYQSTYDQNASPLYDLFQDKDGTPGHTLTASDLAPYTLQPAPSFIDERSSQYVASAGMAADLPLIESQHLDLSGVDRAGPLLEIVAWQLAHPHSAIPPQLLNERQRWEAQHGTGDPS
jgi:DNA-binding beta-propeller fold protein YncE